MIIDIMLSGNYESTRFELKSPIDSLWLSAKMREGLGALIYVINPGQRLCACIAPGISRFTNEVYISGDLCTMNGLRHKPEEGCYTLIIIPVSDGQDRNTAIEIEVETNAGKDELSIYGQTLSRHREISFDNIIDPASRYYKGDFHGHTVFSDGHQTMMEAMEVLQQNQLDFMAFTEHNSMPFSMPESSCLLIPSVELTLPIGHMNIHGIMDLGSFFAGFTKVDRLEEVWDHAIQIFGKECNISLNHMFMEPWHITYDSFDLSKLNTIEVICDPTYPYAPQANDRAVSFLDFLWQEGLKVFGIGGSDSHNRPDELYEGATEPSVYGDPATYVFCEGLSVNHVIKAVRRGHCYVSRYNKLSISIGEGNYLPGDYIPDEVTELTYLVYVENMAFPCIGRFILNGETVWENKMDQDNPSAFYILKPETPVWWLRFGIYDLSNHVIAYVNPVYHKLNQCNITKFKKLKDKFGDSNDQRNLI